jgi:hypothetical protein
MTEEKLLELKAKLKATAEKKFPDAERQKRYIWGTLQKVKKHA